MAINPKSPEGGGRIVGALIPAAITAAIIAAPIANSPEAPTPGMVLIKGAAILFWGIITAVSLRTPPAN